MIRCSAMVGGGGEWGTGAFFFFFFFFFFYIFFFFLFFSPFYIFFFSFLFFPFFFYIFFFFACQLRAQSCTLMIIPLTHYDNFATHFFKVGEICVTVPVLHPPFFFACQLRGQPPPPHPLSDLFLNVDWLPNSVLLLHQRLMVKIKCQWTS